MHVRLVAVLAGSLVLLAVFYWVMSIERRQMIYRQTEQAPLRMQVFKPAPSTHVRGAVLLLHGGGWWVALTDQFVPYARRLAGAGYVAFLAEYRVRGKHGTGIHEALEDAEEALRWVHAQAPHFGFSPSRIAIGGASAGGHLAACVALACSGREDLPAVENLLLINPVLDLTTATPTKGFSTGERELIASLNSQVRTELSPAVKLGSSSLPVFLAYGADDPLADDYQRLIDARTMTPMTVHTFPNEGHGFFQRKEFHADLSQMMLQVLEQ